MSRRILWRDELRGVLFLGVGGPVGAYHLSRPPRFACLGGQLRHVPCASPGASRWPVSAPPVGSSVPVVWLQCGRCPEFGSFDRRPSPRPDPYLTADIFDGCRLAARGEELLDLRCRSRGGGLKNGGSYRWRRSRRQRTDTLVRPTALARSLIVAIGIGALSRSLVLAVIAVVASASSRGCRARCWRSCGH